jgi:hypothetical protein
MADIEMQNPIPPVLSFPHAITPTHGEMGTITFERYGSNLRVSEKPSMGGLLCVEGTDGDIPFVFKTIEKYTNGQYKIYELRYGSATMCGNIESSELCISHLDTIFPADLHDVLISTEYGFEYRLSILRSESKATITARQLLGTSPESNRRMFEFTNVLDVRHELTNEANKHTKWLVEGLIGLVTLCMMWNVPASHLSRIYQNSTGNDRCDIYPPCDFWEDVTLSDEDAIIRITQNCHKVVQSYFRVYTSESTRPVIQVLLMVIRGSRHGFVDQSLSSFAAGLENFSRGNCCGDYTPIVNRDDSKRLRDFLEAQDASIFSQEQRKRLSEVCARIHEPSFVESYEHLGRWIGDAYMREMRIEWSAFTKSMKRHRNLIDHVGATHDSANVIAAYDLERLARLVYMTVIMKHIGVDTSDIRAAIKALMIRNRLV